MVHYQVEVTATEGAYSGMRFDGCMVAWLHGPSAALRETGSIDNEAFSIEMMSE
jgi:hypothetical protein